MDQFNLSPELAKMAFDEFGETPSSRLEALNELRNRINSLPENDRLKDTSDANIIRFLRARKMDVDKAVNSTIQFKHFLDKFADVISPSSPGLELKELVLKCKDFLQVFREPMSAGGKVYVCMRPQEGIAMFTPELKKTNPNAMMQINIWMFDYLSKDPQCQIAGMVICNTFANLTFMDNIALQTMAPMAHQTATFQLFNILGTRLKGAYIFEQPVIMTVIWFLAKPFMSEKIQSRFHLCGKDYNQIQTICSDMSILPTYLGGTLDNNSGSLYVENAVKAMS